MTPDYNNNFHTVRVTAETLVHIQKWIAAAAVESKTADLSFKCCPTQKEHLTALCEEHGYSVSSFCLQGLNFWIRFFMYREKLARHGRFLRSLMDRLL
jgi:hypothetical protein